MAQKTEPWETLRKKSRMLIYSETLGKRKHKAYNTQKTRHKYGKDNRDFTYPHRLQTEASINNPTNETFRSAIFFGSAIVKSPVSYHRRR